MKEADAWLLVGVVVLTVWFVLVFGSIARGAPPEGADQSLAPWFKSLKTPSGTSCCDVSDCRQVQTRTVGGDVEAFVTKDVYGPSAPDAWVKVPQSIWIRGRENPTGEPVLCWFLGRPFCYVDGNGT